MRDASLCDFAAESEGAPAEAAGDDASAGAMAPLSGCAPMSSQLRAARNAPANSQASATNRTPASSQLRIRLASADDADGIRTAYAPFVSTPVTFEEEIPSCEAYRKRIESICEKYPCLVAEEGEASSGSPTPMSCANASPSNGTPSFPSTLHPPRRAVAREVACTPHSSSFCALRA